MPIRRSLTRAIACLAFASPALAQDATLQEQSFFEEFDRMDEGRWYLAEYPSHGDYQNCSVMRRNVAVADGLLTLTFDKHPAFNRDYACASISTLKRYGYGTFEARLKTQDASGLNMNFFTYIGPYHNQPHDEIDFEVITKDNSRVETNAWVNGTPLYGQKLPLDPPADEAFHTYSFIWEPGRIRWYVNGELLAETDNPEVQPKAAQNIFLSIWGTETLVDWMGPFDGSDVPKHMEVDWVSYTAPGEACIHPGSILCTLN